MQLPNHKNLLKIIPQGIFHKGRWCYISLEFASVEHSTSLVIETERDSSVYSSKSCPSGNDKAGGTVLESSGKGKF